MNDNTIRLLDHGHVRLVESMGSDLSIVRNARVSYDAEWRTGEDEGKDAKLIDYLVKNKHTSPFEAVTFTFDVKAPIFVFRQWHRHRTWRAGAAKGQRLSRLAAPGSRFRARRDGLIAVIARSAATKQSRPGRALRIELASLRSQ